MAISMMAATTAAAVIGGGLTAASTIAGGNRAAALGRAAQGEASFEAAQSRLNAGADIAAAQRRAFETDNTTNLLVSKARATGAAGGVNVGTGSALENEGTIAQRGHFAAALDLWNGQNQASGELNKAAGLEYTGAVDVIGGNMQRDASYLTAGGQMMTTLAGAGSTAYTMYGKPPATGATPGPSDSYYTGD